MATSDLKVCIRVRYTRWARFVLRVVSLLHRLHCPALVLRLVMLACWFQMRADGALMAMPWRGVRVPYPKKVSRRNGR